jgi:hypothetical protein
LVAFRRVLRRVVFLAAAFFLRLRAAISWVTPLSVNSSPTDVHTRNRSALSTVHMPRQLARPCCPCPLSESGMCDLTAFCLVPTLYRGTRATVATDRNTAFSGSSRYKPKKNNMMGDVLADKETAFDRTRDVVTRVHTPRCRARAYGRSVRTQREFRVLGGISACACGGRGAAACASCACASSCAAS